MAEKKLNGILFTATRVYSGYGPQIAQSPYNLGVLETTMGLILAPLQSSAAISSLIGQPAQAIYDESKKHWTIITI